MSKEVLLTVGGSEKYMAKDMVTGRANGLGPIAQPTTPGYIQIHMIVFFWSMTPFCTQSHWLQSSYYPHFTSKWWLIT